MTKEKQFNLFISSGSQLYEEVHNVIRRYERESDITTFQIIGALDAVKMDIHNCLNPKKKRKM